ncbi:hypothetical protein [Phyllobacterium sp. YR531]|uniref:hypothetical protein n=1 Tax=Phyllobacterium sp. YR531 TaxID=1144343 RepID=UPI00026F5AFE|nr:hypothetical protein [Phyllobacterium sp. YR531]EJN05654.1 hypothetical protein PMI41_00861 [Phyllobacterium sp. YR531]
MYEKADGSRVWLKTHSRTPYLAINGRLHTSEDYSTIRQRLLVAYEVIPNLSSEDAFLVEEPTEAGSLLFCAQADLNCAVLLIGVLGQIEQAESNETLLPQFFKRVSDAVLSIQSSVRANVQLQAIQCELAMHGG